MENTRKGFKLTPTDKDKRIEELEYQLAHRNCVDCSNHSSKLRMKNLDLEKENAELKEQCSILADCNTCTSACKTENIEMKKQLTKAKKIIKALLRLWNDVMTEETVKALIAEAEQFISEVEK